MKKHYEPETEETELTKSQKRRIYTKFGFGAFFFLLALAASFSFAAILWQANIAWVQNIFSFFIFSFLFIQYATPTVILASVLSAIFLAGARKTPLPTMRKVGIVLFILDIVFLITAIIIAIQLA